MLNYSLSLCSGLMYMPVCAYLTHTPSETIPLYRIKSNCPLLCGPHYLPRYIYHVIRLQYMYTTGHALLAEW
jgi:hypothetical protein